MREFFIKKLYLTDAEHAVHALKVHKNENLFGSNFEFCTISLLVMLKYLGFVKKLF
jgi:hypothetical protein